MVEVDPVVGDTQFAEALSRTARPVSVSSAGAAAWLLPEVAGLRPGHRPIRGGEHVLVRCVASAALSRAATAASAQ